jgi:hypothetical protein
LGVNARRVAAIIVACAVACSSYGSEDEATPAPPRADGGTDESSTPAGDAQSSDADVTLDAGDAGPTRCDRSRLFGDPIVVPGLATEVYEGSAQLTSDELHVFWGRYDTAWAIWTASRNQRSDAFTDPVRLTVVNDAGVTLDPAPSTSGLQLYFSSDRLGTFDLFFAKRAALDIPFDPPTKVDEASGPDSDRRPFLAADGKSVWFDSARSGASRIYRLPVSALGNGSAELVDLGAASNVVGDASPVLASDGLALYFSSNGRETSDSTVYMATRATIGDPFGTPVRVVTTAGFMAPSWISADECRLYVTVSGNGFGTRIRMVERAK